MPDPRPATPDEIIDGYAEMFGVPSALARAVAQRESGANPNVQPGDGGKAIGMFQLHEGAGIDTGVQDRANPAQNIMGGIKYLKQLSDRYKGDVSKTLQAYNGGMEGVDAGTVSPEAQAYATAVISEMTRGAAQTAPGGPSTAPTLTDQSYPVTKPKSKLDLVHERQAATKARLKEHEPVRDFAAGAVREAVSGVQTLASPIRKAFGMEPATPPPEETTTAGKAGRVATQVGEFALGSGAVSGGIKAAGLTGKAKMAARVLGEGASAFGVTKVQGGTDTGAGINAGVAAVAPVASKALELYGPAMRAKAVTKLARVFAKGVENAGPEIQYGLKTGDLAPDVADAARIVMQAASDTMDIPLQASWGKWMTTAGKEVAAKGKTLGSALEGELGSEMLFKQPIYDALDDLVSKSASHFAEVSAGKSASGMTDSAQKVYNQPLFDAVVKLKDSLDGYGPMISVRNLSDLKQTWDKAVYGLSTAGKVAVSPEVLTATAQKEATKRGADAIRAVFDQKTPTIAELNEAASHAYRLQDLVRKLHKVSPGLKPGASTVLHVAGAGTGATIGQVMGGHTLYGIMAGGAMARALEKAFESPLWQTASPVLKGKIATALANGQGDMVRQLIAPFISAGVSRETQPAAGAR